MAFIPKSRTEIKNTINNLLDSVGAEALSGGITENIINGAVDILYASELKKAQIDSQSNPTLSTGVLLDAIANSIGIHREKGSPVVDLTYTNFHFYINDNSTAKDITNDNGSFIIPSGIQIQDTFGNEYITLADAIFREDSSIVYVPIAATGPISNDVPVNSLLEHGFEILSLDNVDTVSLGNTKIFCTNNRVIKGVAQDESDQNLRHRINVFGESLNQSNESRLISIIETINGVTDVSLDKNKRGIGSIEVTIKTDTSTPSDALYAQAEALIKRYIYGADNIYVLKPHIVPIKMTINIIFKSAVIENMDEIRSKVSVLVSDDINISISQGGTFEPQRIIELVSDNIDDVENVSIGCLHINNRRVIVGRQQLRKDQKFIVLNPTDITVG